MILQGNTLPEMDTGFQLIKWVRDLGGAKQDEMEHWYRVLNDGSCPLDTLPFVQEYNEYKHWADQIEH